MDIVDIELATTDDLKVIYMPFLKKNLIGSEIGDIAGKIKKSPQTVYNYIKGEGNDYLTLKAIAEIGTDILKKKNIFINGNNVASR